ncbi:MAG: T9SS type A sorting domain-containing protein, partial [Bacteroidetes bacterium]|nr:T9SS type A sorting domain-containing protein [Bacteroidota bacterium]
LNEEIAFAVGDPHWDQNLKAFRSTILKSTDGGYNWLPADIHFSEQLWDVQFLDTEEGWITGTSGLLLHTLDGGDHWTRTELGTDLDLKSLCFADASHGWVVANEVLKTDFRGDPEAWKGKILHTTNGGDNWSEQFLPEEAGLIHCIYFTSNLEGWAIGVKNEDIDYIVETKCAAYYTNDGGETWIEKYSPDLDFVFTDIVFPDADHGFMVGFKANSGETNGSIFRSSDGGDNWQRCEENRTLWEVDFLDSLHGYAMGSSYGAAWGPPVYRTMDGGESWDIIRMDKHDGQGIYGLEVQEEKVIAMGDQGYLVRSDDPWGDYEDSQEGFAESYGDHLFTHHLINTLYNFEDVFFIDVSKGWVVGQKSEEPESWAQVILHSDDGGESWEEQYSFQTEIVSGMNTRLNAVEFVNGSTGWAVGKVERYDVNTNSGILHTNDGGETWVQQVQDVASNQIVDLFFFDDQKGWALSNEIPYPDMYIQALKTSDGGTSWEGVNTGQKGNITIGWGIRSGALHFQNEQSGWILGAQCDLLKTEDGGASWTRKYLPEDWTNTYDIAFSDDLHATICGEANFASTDGGETWSEDLENDYNFTDLCFTDSIHGWMVGSWGIIMYSQDGGESWEQMEHAAMGVSLKAVSFADNVNGWTVGTGGVILHIDPSYLSTYTPEIHSPFASSLSQNQPNPFSNHTEISFTLKESGNAALVIYDTNGRFISMIHEGYRDKGIHTVSWNGNDVNGTLVKPGVYIYKLTTKEGIASRSMIVL